MFDARSSSRLDDAFHGQPLKCALDLASCSVFKPDFNLFSIVFHLLNAQLIRPVFDFRFPPFVYAPSAAPDYAQPVHRK